MTEENEGNGEFQSQDSLGIENASDNNEANTMTWSHVVDENGGKREIKIKGTQKTKNKFLKRNQRGKTRNEDCC